MKWAKWKWAAAAKRAGEFGDLAAAVESRGRETRGRVEVAQVGEVEVGGTEKSKKGEETGDNRARSSPVRARKFKLSKQRKGGGAAVGDSRVNEGWDTLPFFKIEKTS